MIGFPILYSNKLILRKLVFEDLPHLVKYANNKKIADRIINIPHPYNEPDAAFRMRYIVSGFKNKTRIVFAIILKEKDTFIGEISLHLEDSGKAQLGYWIGEPFWGKGICSEAVGTITKYGFDELDLKLIYASTHLENIASQKLLLKNRFKKEKEIGNVIPFTIDASSYKSIKTIDK